MSFCMTLRIGSDSCLQIRKISINIIDLQFHLSCTKASTCSLAKLQVIPASISRSTHRFIGSPTGEFCIAASVESPCNFDRMAMGSGGSKKRPIFSRKLSPCSFRKYIYILYIYGTCRDFGKPIKLGGFPWCLGVDGRSPIPFAHLQTLNLEPIGSKKARGQPGGRRFPPGEISTPWVWWASWVPSVFSPQPQRVVGKIVAVIGLDAANKMWSNLEMLKKRGNKYPPSPQKIKENPPKNWELQGFGWDDVVSTHWGEVQGVFACGEFDFWHTGFVQIGWTLVRIRVPETLLKTNG